MVTPSLVERSTNSGEADLFYRLMCAGKQLSLAVARRHRLSQEEWAAMQRDLLAANLPQIFKWRWAHAGCGRAWEQARKLGIVP